MVANAIVIQARHVRPVRLVRGGFVMAVLKFPTAPLILGFILGPLGK
jgi:TctA family transporter